MNKLDEILSHLNNVKPRGEDFTAQCPIHADSKNSFSIFKAYDGNYIPFCHAGCSLEEIRDWLKSLNLNFKFKDKGITNIYQYYSPDGEETFQCCRYFPKDFKQRRKSGDKWVWDLKGVELTLYRLPELITSEISRAVFITEGEKDCDRLISNSLISVSPPLGAGKWKETYNKFLKDRTVYIVEDNDSEEKKFAGQKGALKIAESLVKDGHKNLKIISFKEYQGIKDVSDFLDSHSMDELKELIKKTPKFEFSQIEEKPVIKPEAHYQLPAAPLLELEIINSCLADNTLFLRAYEFIDFNSFYLPIHKRAWQIATASYEHQAFVDKNLVLSKMIDEGKESLRLFEEKLTGVCLSYYQFEIYCRDIQMKSRLRNLIKLSDDFSQKAREAPSEELFEQFEQQVFSLTNSLEENPDGDFEDLGQAVSDTIHKAESFTGELLGISSGYTDLDEKTSGLQKEDLIIIAARPSMGKTSLATDIISNTIPDNLKVAFFTLEMSKEQVVNKIISQNLEIPAQRIKKWDLSFQEKEDVQNFKSQILDSNIKINFKPGINIVQMKRSLRRLVSKIGPLDLIVIDYLQLMGTYGKYESKEKAVSDISKGLKEVAREFKCPVIALSQLNRKPEERKGDHKPIMSDLRESGAIEQDADIIIFLYREDYYKKDTENQGVTEGIISKNRQGPTGSFYLQFIKEYTHFENSTFQNDGSF